MATPNYDIDYSAKEFKDVKLEEKTALNGNNTFYNKAVKDINNAIDTQKDDIKAWGEKQAQLQQDRTDFAIDQIEQKKEQAQKDYIKEQSASYVDWQKQSNAYGANAEQMAAQGMTNTGYSESSQVSMYNEYQRRVTAARETIERAKLEFDNQINQAKLQNDSLLAEIAYNTLKEINTLTLAGVEKTTLLRSEQKKRELEIKQMYHDRWQDVLKQINTENALKEEVRQAQENEAYRNAQLELEREKFNYQKEQDEAKGTISARGGSSSGTKITSRPTRVSPGVQKAKDNRAKKEGSNEPVYTIDYDSLTKAGYAGASAATINKAVEEGLLTVTKKNGKLVYSRSPLSRVAGFVP